MNAPTKAHLRVRIRAAREALSSDRRVAAADAIRDVVLALPEVHGARSIAAYAGVDTEPGTLSLLDALRIANIRVLLPVLGAEWQLRWADYEDRESLTESRFGLLEPTTPSRAPESISDVDVVIAPALAVDRTGNRLGRGGGAYDRALSHLSRSTPVIALVYDDEVLDHVPADEHDVPVNVAVTPGGVVRLRELG